MIGILRWAAVCAALGIGLAEAAAQGTIEGTVTDRATGDPVTGATVVVKGTLRGAACDAMGRYRIAGLDAGTYDLEVTMLTYAPCLIPDVEVRSGQTARADAALEEQREEIDQAWWNLRIAVAYDVRRTLDLTDNPATTCYRLVHGEGDSLPGLVVDIYGPVAVIQCHSAGMYHARMQIAEALRTVYGARLTAIYDKSSQTLPFKAALGAVDGYLWGTSDHASHIVLENGERFCVNWEKGQKTGFFLDQRENRQLVKRYAKGRTVLNTFCYTGGFSVYAMAGGAEKVCSVDSSERAVVLATENMKLNFGPQANFTETAADAVEYLKNIEDKYDLIILDPPAFAKHHKVLGNAMQGYKRLNARAISQIRPGGILFTFSCSQAVSKELFRTMIFSAAAIAGRNVRILHQLTQPADHPVSIYHPEGEYLKGLVLYVE